MGNLKKSKNIFKNSRLIQRNIVDTRRALHHLNREINNLQRVPRDDRINLIRMTLAHRLQFLLEYRRSLINRLSVLNNQYRRSLNSALAR